MRDCRRSIVSECMNFLHIFVFMEETRIAACETECSLRIDGYILIAMISGDEGNCSQSHIVPLLRARNTSRPDTHSALLLDVTYLETS